MITKQKLELTWIGKGDEPSLEPRILIEDPSKSYGDPNSQNMLIHGDNLLALKALEHDYTGKIKCVYIDPPYNTGSAWEHYDDAIEHSLWLNLMRPRLEIIRNLLRDDGCIFLHIDNSEQAYLKVLCDEIFGRSNFITTFAVQVRHSERMLKGDKDIHDVVEYILMYRKSNSFVISKRIKAKSDDEFEGYEYSVIEKAVGKPLILGGKNCLSFNANEFEIIRQKSNIKGLKKINIRGGLREGNSSGRFYVANLEDRINEDGFNTLYKVPNMGDDGLGYRYFISRENEDKKNGNYFQGKPQTKISSNLLPYPSYFNFQSEFNRVGYEGVVQFRNSKKPEMLIKTMFDIAGAKSGDWALDSFLGSGTTAAVAQKTGLRYIGIEMGEHAYSHCKIRLDEVIDGKDSQGITEISGWQGGGGYKFYELATSLLTQDNFGNWIIAKEYDANLLAHAMAKQEGFTYLPDQTTYWKQGYSTESDYIFTTTQHITIELIDAIHNAMQDSESLLIACKAFDGASKDRYDNITIKKIPQILLGRCEFGRNDYSLNVIESVDPEDTDGDMEE